VSEVIRTIPQVLSDSADRDPGKVWLRTDEGTATFAGAAGQVGLTAGRLSAAGVRRGDLVVVTARTTAPYLFCWLALSAIGAITVPTNPRGTSAELAGLLAQTRPRALISDAGLGSLAGSAITPGASAPALLDAAALAGDWTSGSAGGRPPTGAAEPGDVAVLIPTSGTTGRSKLVMQTHGAFTMAGEGFNYSGLSVYKCRLDSMSVLYS
jgi:carnitine-CoA ligase